LIVKVSYFVIFCNLFNLLDAVSAGLGYREGTQITIVIWVNCDLGALSEHQEYAQCLHSNSSWPFIFWFNFSHWKSEIPSKADENMAKSECIYQQKIPTDTPEPPLPKGLSDR
jgi:hypothetical protein